MKNKIILASLILIHVFLLSRLVFFPYPEIFVYPYLINHGFLPYLNIFDQHFPGLLMLPINFAKLGIGGPMAAKIWLFASVVVSQILIYLTILKLTKNKLLGFSANIFYLFTQVLFEGYIFWVDSLLAPILLFAFLLLISSDDLRKRKHILLSGFTLGLAVVMKQTFITIPVFLAIYYLFFQKVGKRILPFCVGFCVPLAALVAWIVEKGILGEFVYWTFVFNIIIYAPMARKLPTLTQLVRVAVYFSPILYLFFSKNKKILISLAVFTLFAMLPALGRFEFVHLQPVFPFTAIFFALMISSNTGRFKNIILTGIIALTLVWFPAYVKNHLGSKIYFFDSDTIDTSQIVKSNTKPSDRIFVLGAQPVIYSLADRLPAGGVFTVAVPWNMKAAQEKILAGLKSNNPKMVVRDSSAAIDGQKVVEFAPLINEYINVSYVKLTDIGANEILIRR
jgi:hypothetical protein